MNRRQAGVSFSVWLEASARPLHDGGYRRASHCPWCHRVPRSEWDGVHLENRFVTLPNCQTYGEIATRVGVTPRTVLRWVQRDRVPLYDPTVDRYLADELAGSIGLHPMSVWNDYLILLDLWWPPNRIKEAA